MRPGSIGVVEMKNPGTLFPCIVMGPSNTYSDAISEITYWIEVDRAERTYVFNQTITVIGHLEDFGIEMDDL